MSTHFILINGKKRSGKNHFASLLQKQLSEENKTSAIIAYADPIKDIIAITLGISANELNAYKNNPEKYKVVTTYDCSEGCYNVSSTTHRKMLQLFGTEAMQKHFGINVWVDSLLNKAKSLDVDYVIVPDFRFKSEHLEGSTTVTIMNWSIPSNDTHKSENDLNDFEFDWTIDNTEYGDISSQVSDFIQELP